MQLSKPLLAAIVSAVTLTAQPTPSPALEGPVQLGPRPYYLVEQMKEGPLKTKLEQCTARTPTVSRFSIGHRGAPLQFPEHTRESYLAAARMGAGILECDVAFTRDRQLVCRHSQCDLHTTTNVLAIPELAAKCSQPFTPADPAKGTRASAKCCTSDFTLAELRQLKGKMDAGDKKAETVEAYMDATAPWRTDLYASTGTLMSHKESIALFKRLGAKFTPELKKPAMPMPYEGDYSQQDYAEQLVQEYKEAGIPPEDVYLQSFNLDDVLYWIEHHPDFGKQAVYLDGRYDDEGFDPAKAESWKPSMQELAAKSVKIIAPPMWMLVTRDEEGAVVPSLYAKEAKKAGLKIITWTLERSGPLNKGGGWYYQSIKEATRGDGDMYVLLDVLAQDVGVIGVFSDWPATVTYYANCMNLK